MHEQRERTSDCLPSVRPDDSRAVIESIADRLRDRERLTFAEFMDLALYLPGGGYYAAPDSLPARDYRTSPEVHPLFGALIALQLEQMWRCLGEPASFHVVEPGAGTGALCRDILRFSGHLDTAFQSALRYVIVEPRPFWQERQRATLSPHLISTEEAPVPACTHSSHSPRLSSTVSLSDGSCRVTFLGGSALDLPLRNVVGCFLSNELLDAFPVHRVVRQGGVLLESYVVARHGRLAETLDLPSTPDLERYFDRLGLLPPEGCLVEVNLAAPAYAQQTARALSRGFVLTIDYGFPAEELYSPDRPAGTLRCYRQHRCNDAPLTSAGRQDITAHVDFSTFILAGREAGLRFAGLTSQADFLLNLGGEAFVARLEAADLPAGRKYDNKFAWQELISKGQLGAFRVLAQHKDVPDPALDGFNPCGDTRRLLVTGKRALPLPLL